MTSAHPDAIIALDQKAKRKWSQLGFPLMLGLLVLLNMGSTADMPTPLLVLYGGPGALMVFIFATVDAWVDDEGLHHRSADTWGMTRLVPASDIAVAQISSPPGQPTLQVLRHDGTAVNIVAVRKRFVGEAELQRWIDVINDRFASR